MMMTKEVKFSFCNNVPYIIQKLSDVFFTEIMLKILDDFLPRGAFSLSTTEKIP